MMEESGVGVSKTEAWRFVLSDIFNKFALSACPVFELGCF